MCAADAVGEGTGGGGGCWEFYSRCSVWRASCSRRSRSTRSSRRPDTRDGGPSSPTHRGSSHFLGSAVFRTVDTNRSIGTVFDQLGLWLVLTVLSGVFVMVMFFIFAFSAWPSLQVARSRSAPRPAFSSGGVGPPPPVPVATGTPTAPEQHEGQAPGWYRTGALGAGEQSYWDGQTWTARRIWNRGAWKALPPEDQSLDQAAGCAGRRVDRGLRRRLSGPRGSAGARLVRPAWPLGDLAGPDARGAHLDPLRRTVHHRAHPLHVGVPAPLGAPVRVAHVHAERGLLSADLAHRCHR